MVIPRAFSSGAASISSYFFAVAPPDLASTIVIAAVSVVLPWSTCPIVPMLQCGFVRANFSLAIVLPSAVFQVGWVDLERVVGIEPASSAWKAAALPLCYTRAPSRALEALLSVRGQHRP